MIVPVCRPFFFNLLSQPKIFTSMSRDVVMRTTALLTRTCSTLPENPSFPWNQYPKKIKLLETKTHICPKEVEKSLVDELERAKIQQACLKSSKTQSVFQRMLSFLFENNNRIIPMQIEECECQEARSVAIAAQGRKEGMEDAHLLNRFQVMMGGEKKTAIVNAVFDGHAGDECAKFAVKYLIEFLINHLEAKNEKELSDLGTWNALTLALVYLSQSYNPTLYIEGEFNWAAGTTANIAMRIDQTLWIANVGDSRAIVVKQNGAVQQLSEDAKAGLLRYKERVEERFGTVVYTLTDPPRINGQLAVGGALGDHNLNGAVSARPAITKLDISSPDLKKAVLIQASDGLWDVFNAEEVAELYTRLSQKGMSNRLIGGILVQSAYQKGAADNITLVISTLPSCGN